MSTPRLVSRLFAATTLLIIAPLGACTGELIPPLGGSGGAVGSGGGTNSGGAVGSGGVASSGGAVGTGGGTPSGGATGAGGNWQDEDFDSIAHGPTFQFFRKVVARWPNNCTGADCHGGTPAHISLVPDEGLYERVTTAMSDNVCLDENDMPMKIIVPGEPENSALIRILKGPCETTGRMPGGECIVGSDCLPDDFIGFLETWIANGAPETETGGSSGGSTSSGGTSSGGSTP